MNTDFIQISGWVFAGLSLVVNILQYFKTSNLKKQIAKQHIGDNSTANQQTHSGAGHNVNAGRDAHINKA